MAQHDRNKMRTHVLGKMKSEHHGAITKTNGGYRVNDLNPATQARHPHGFGVSDTKAEALKHLRAIEYFKHRGG